jgi:hypothetical protein
VEGNKLEPILSKMYFEVSQAVNNRIIGIFNKFQVVTGERWFNSGVITAQDFDITKQPQTYRQVYTFDAIVAGATITIDHNIVAVKQFTRIYGTCITTLPDFRPIPYASVIANANIDLTVTSTQIVISNGAGGQDIVSGIIVLEYLLN